MLKPIPGLITAILSTIAVYAPFILQLPSAAPVTYQQIATPSPTTDRVSALETQVADMAYHLKLVTDYLEINIYTPTPYEFTPAPATPTLAPTSTPRNQYDTGVTLVVLNVRSAPAGAYLTKLPIGEVIYLRTTPGTTETKAGCLWRQRDVGSWVAVECGDSVYVEIGS